MVGWTLPCVALVNAIPTPSFPINSQVPTVARVSVPFSFTFSASTFSSPFPLNYSLSNAPDWLSLDGATRTLSGIPSKAETPSIEIIASDETGSATMEAVLVVSDKPAPEVKIPLEYQLASFGMYSLPNSVLCQTLTPFEFSFNLGTFEGNNLTYYATTLENAPLPSWIQFSEESLSFSGLTPDAVSNIQPPQAFGLQLIASDVIGFAGVSIPFYIVVERHMLEFSNGFLYINVTVGSPMDFTGLADSLRLDGKAVNNSNIVTINAETPSWISFDNSTLALKGTAPSIATSHNVSVTAIDAYGDAANATVQIQVVNSTFVASIGPLNATAGVPFSHDLGAMVLDPSDVNMSVKISPATSWLSFDNRTLVLSGVIPPETPLSNISVILQATSKSSHTSESRILILNIVPNSGSPTAIPTASPTGTTSSPAQQSPGGSGNKLNGGSIAAIVVSTVLVFIALLLCLLYYIRKRQLAKKRSSKSDMAALIQNSKQAQDILSVAETDQLGSDRDRGSDVGFSKGSEPRLGSLSYSDVTALESPKVRNSWIPSATNGLPLDFGFNLSTPRVARNFSRKWKEASLESGRPEFAPQAASLSPDMKPWSSIQQTLNSASGTRENRGRATKYLGDILEIDWREIGAGHRTAKAESELSGFGNERPNATYGHGEEEASRRGSTRRINNAGAPYGHNMIEMTDSATMKISTPEQMTPRGVSDGSDQASSTGPSESNEYLQRRIRRSVGSSPFFAGSSRSRRYRRPDSPPLAETDTVNDPNEKYLVEPGGLGASDEFGIRHIRPHGTGQHLGISPKHLHSWTKLSIQFSDGDNLFESTESSPGTERFSFLFQDEVENEHHGAGYQAPDQESYETSDPGSSRNSIHYDSDELHEMTQPEVRLTGEERELTSVARGQ